MKDAYCDVCFYLQIAKAMNADCDAQAAPKSMRAPLPVAVRQNDLN